MEFLPAVNSKDVKQDCLVGFLLKDLQGIDAWKTIVVIYNFNKEAKEMAIPEGNYTIACCNGTIDEAGLGEVSGKEILVDGQSALILFQK